MLHVLSGIIYLLTCECVCVRACVRVCVRACVRACVCCLYNFIDIEDTSWMMFPYFMNTRMQTNLP